MHLAVKDFIEGGSCDNTSVVTPFLPHHRLLERYKPPNPMNLTLTISYHRTDSERLRQSPLYSSHSSLQCKQPALSPHPVFTLLRTACADCGARTARAGVYPTPAELPPASNAPGISNLSAVRPAIETPPKPGKDSAPHGLFGSHLAKRMRHLSQPPVTNVLIWHCTSEKQLPQAQK